MDHYIIVFWDMTYSQALTSHDPPLHNHSFGWLLPELGGEDTEHAEACRSFGVNHYLLWGAGAWSVFLWSGEWSWVYPKFWNLVDLRYQ